MRDSPNQFINIMNRISFFQITILGIVSFASLLIYKDYSIFSGLVIMGLASFTYTQLIKLGHYNKVFALFGFPIRLMLVVPPSAILVHKLHSNLLALFIGFTISQVIFFILIWMHIKYINKEIN